MNLWTKHPPIPPTLTIITVSSLFEHLTLHFHCFYNMDLKLANNLEELEKLFGSRMHEYEEKLKKASASTGTVAVGDISALSSEFSEFKSFVLQALTTMKSQIGLLTSMVDKHETFMRRKVLLIHGVPEKKDEKLLEVVAKILSDKMKLADVSEGSLHACHRLGSSAGKTRPILVRFLNMEHRHMVWDAKTMLKGTGITVSEFLTKSRHRVFMAARQHFGLKRCWTIEGKVVVMVSPNTRRKIETASELQLLVKNFPDSLNAVVPAATGAAEPAPSVAERAAKKPRRRT